jgi:phenylpropionate dioxygenase-like ring-hydroxylating dioxygenase large terminal subunit
MQVTLLENVLDVSHVPFTHHKTVGNRNNASPVLATITREAEDGFDAFWEEGPPSGKARFPNHSFSSPPVDVA